MVIKRHIIQILLILTLFGAYALSALLLSVVGVNVYTLEAANIENNYDMRTGALYLSEKIRQHDARSNIRTDQVPGSDALVLTENTSGKGYETWIYVYNGSLREILVPPDHKFNLSSAQVIMPMKKIEAVYSMQLIDITLHVSDDQITQLNIFPRSVREVP